MYEIKNKHCEVLVSCSAERFKKIKKTQKLQEPSGTYRKLQEPSKHLKFRNDYGWTDGH